MKDPVSNEPLLHASDPLHVNAQDSNSSQFAFNILPFNHPEKSREFTFTAQQNVCEHRFLIKKLPAEASCLFTLPDPQHPFVYTNFDVASAGIPVIIDFNEQPAIARAWYTLNIRTFLQQYANVTVTNFLNDCQYWFHEKNVNNSIYDVYKKFTIRVQTEYKNGKPELLIAYDGKSYILKKSVAQLTENATFNTRILKTVLYRKQIYDYENIPENALYHKDEVFPLIDREIRVLLNVNIPVTINRDKYKTAYNEIEQFYTSYLSTDEFRKIIPHQGNWKTVFPGDVHRLSDTGRNLVFGQGHIAPSKDIFMSLKNKGPYSLPPARHVKVFMIYYEPDLDAARKLKEYILRKEGFGSLAAFTNIDFEYDVNLDIVINPDKNAVETIRESLKTRTKDNASQYYAFYISPYTRFEPQSANHAIYFRIKELMLQYEIGLQVLERDKIFGKFDFFIANIGIAMIAKMGGIPWRLSTKEDKELIVGFGAFKSSRYNTRYIGASFCFSNDGTFHEFDCFPADETWSIAGSAEAALIEYRKNNPEVKRLVIHFYQKIGRRQLKPIEDMLRKLELDIPVIIVRINKTFSESQLVFDTTSPGKMPLNGSYFQTGQREYLFCINEREDYTTNPSSLPLPIKIGFQSGKPELVNNPALIERLMRQVYEFSFMYWRSVKQQNLPVTITFPEMLAQLFPWFDSGTLPEAGRKSLFFL